jgi:hypothetical protein
VDIGIQSYEDIDRLGSVEVYRRLRESRPGVTLKCTLGPGEPVAGL